MYIRDAFGSEIVVVADEVKATASRDHPYQEYWEKIENVAFNDAEFHYQVAMWCKDNGLEKASERELRMVLLVDRDNASARKILGYVKEAGRWIKEE